MDETETVIHTEGSAFHALGLPDAEDLLVRADLFRRIVAIVRSLGEANARERLSLGASAFKSLVTDDLNAFGTEHLLIMLRDLGHDIELRISPTRSGSGRLHVSA